MSTDHDLSGLIGGPGVPRALGLHAGRYLRVWSRQPASYLTALVVPLIYLYITHELFGGFIRTLTGTLDANHITMVVAVSWAFVLAVSGSGAMLAELLLCALMMVLVETVSAWTTGFTCGARLRRHWWRSRSWRPRRPRAPGCWSRWPSTAPRDRSASSR